MKRLHHGTVVDRAVRLIPVGDVLLKLGVQFPGTPPAGSSYKVYCPFGELHPDRGAEKEMRLYADGRAFCHICRRQYDSVSLFAQAVGVSPVIAARQLLVDAGYSSKDDDQGIRVVEDIPPEKLQARALAALAVWADAHEIDRFSDAYLRVSDTADHITEQDHVRRWLDAAKRRLSG